ncbi:hypothetical protein, partial [Rhabdothermincola sp.]|uniref:hypothetical protein n=1 Tax=Rhabdothermincola sp. TaxID=2820405 RepID=UPI002FE07709
PTVAPPARARRVRSPAGAHDTGVVGFNPFRGRRSSGADYAMVIAALVVVALLMAWALFG